MMMPVSPNRIVRSQSELARRLGLSDWTVSRAINGHPAVKESTRKRVLKAMSDLGFEADPLQTRTLAYWPDGSIKWAQLIFPIASSKTKGDAPAPRISFRKGTALPVSVRIADEASPAPSAELRTTTSEAGEVRIDNGALTIILNTGENWLQQLTLGTETIVDADSRAVAYCDYQRNPEATDPFTHQLTGVSKTKAF